MFFRPKQNIFLVLSLLLSFSASSSDYPEEELSPETVQAADSLLWTWDKICWGIAGIAVLNRLADFFPSILIRRDPPRDPLGPPSHPTFGNIPRRAHFTSFGPDGSAAHPTVRMVQYAPPQVRQILVVERPQPQFAQIAFAQSPPPREPSAIELMEQAHRAAMMRRNISPNCAPEVSDEPQHGCGSRQP